MWCASGRTDRNRGLRCSQDSPRPSSWLLSTSKLYCLPVQAGFFHPRRNNQSRENRRPAFSVQVRKSGERAVIGPYWVRCPSSDQWLWLADGVIWEHGSLCGNYVTEEGDVVRGCVHAWDKTAQGRQSWESLVGEPQGFWRALEQEWPWVKTSQHSSKAGGRNGDVHFLEVEHNISAYIIGQNWVGHMAIPREIHEQRKLMNYLFWLAICQVKIRDSLTKEEGQEEY